MSKLRYHHRRGHLHGNIVGRLGWPSMIAHHAPKISVKSATIVVAAIVLWLFLIAVLTVV